LGRIRAVGAADVIGVTKADAAVIPPYRREKGPPPHGVARTPAASPVRVHGITPPSGGTPAPPTGSASAWPGWLLPADWGLRQNLTILILSSTD